ncbi:MAG: hypothetical protein K8S18_03275 [Desulfobacula sp.]|nr:hypothetical protein [Desulfobacula sp.]
MAGIIVSIGKNSFKGYKNIKRKYEAIKNLKCSFEFKSDIYHIAKYQRMFDTEDLNYFQDRDICVCAVGSVLYKKYSFDESIRKLGIDISNGSDINDLINDIDGHFFIVVIQNDKLTIITDAGGVINTYCLQEENSIYITTSMLSLATTFDVTQDDEAILTFLRASTFLNTDTYFNEIKTLKSAQIYRYEPTERYLNQKTYWTVPKETDNSYTFDSAADLIKKSLFRIIDAIPVDKAIFDFTGGNDCRFVLFFVFNKNEENAEKINTFFFGPPESREAKIVEKNSKNLGMTYNNYEISDSWSDVYYEYVLRAFHLSDGLENAFNYATILWVQEKKSKKYKFSVNGLIGELYRQRTWEFEFGKRGRKCPANFYRFIKYRDLAGSFNASVFSDEARYIINNVADKMLSVYEKLNEEFTSNTPNTLQLENIFFQSRSRRHGRNVTTSNQLIQQVCPLWFRKPLEISFSMSPDYKKRCKLMKSIVEKGSYDFAKEKVINGTPFLNTSLKNFYLFVPGILFFARKVIRKAVQILFNRTIWKGLTTPDYNTGDWFRKALSNEHCEKLLTWDTMVSKKYYDKDKFQNFVNQASDPDFSFYDQLGNMITVELTLQSVKNKTVPF